MCFMFPIKLSCVCPSFVYTRFYFRVGEAILQKSSRPLLQKKAMQNTGLNGGWRVMHADIFCYILFNLLFVS